MSPLLKAVVVGDVVVDYVVDLSKESVKKYSDLDNRYEEKVTQLVGGSARNFAVCAIKAGFSISLVSKIGSKSENPKKPDSNGQFIIDSLKKEKITPILSLANHGKTGKVIIVYLPNDKRLMISDRGTSVSFQIKDLNYKIFNAVRRADLLYVDGYNSLKNPLKTTAKFLMKEANKNNTLVAFDVVPHKIYQKISFRQLKSYTKYVDVISFELNTARRFLGFSPVRKLPSEKNIIESLKPFTSIYQVVFTRVGNDCLILSHKGLFDRIKTKYREDIGLLKRGYFDKAFTKFLHHYISTNQRV